MFFVHLSCRKRKTHSRFFPLPRSTKHSSLQITFRHSGRPHSSLSLHHDSRAAADSTVRSGRFLASQLVRPYALSSLYTVFLLYVSPDSRIRSAYFSFGWIRAIRIRSLLSRTVNSFGRPERDRDMPWLRSSSRDSVDLEVEIGVPIALFIAYGMTPASSCPTIQPLWYGVRSGPRR